MFLRERSTQAEYCDRPDLTPAEVRSVHHQLDRIHQLLHSADSFQAPLARWLGDSRVHNVSLLDLGAGDGAMGRHLEAWAGTKGWNWRVTSIDSNFTALALGTGERRVAGNVCALPFANDSFDVVLASQMTHHLSEDEVVRHFAEAWRVSRDIVCLFDAHRNVFALGLIQILLSALGFSREFRSDAALSVRRGWRVPEWELLAARAGISGAAIHLQHGARIRLFARKRSPASAVLPA